MITEEQWEQIQKSGIHVESVRKARLKNNQYLKKYGSAMWNAAVLTAYAGGGWEMLNEMYFMPVKYQKMLLDAYRYVNATRELGQAQASSRPYMKKSDGRKYINNLVNIINGNEKTTDSLESAIPHHNK